jgi:glycosyltransferase involved in cell wall biosynthesis
LTPGQVGGTRHYDFARELIARGHSVTIFASSYHYTLYRELKKYQKGHTFLHEKCDGIDFVWIKTHPYKGNGIGRVINMLDYMFKAGRTARNMKVSPDIVVGSSVHLFAVYSAYRMAKRYRIPFVMEVRDIWPQTLIDMGISKWHPFVLLLGLMESFLYKRADEIITLLPGAHRHIESFGIESGRIHWVSNGVDIKRFDSSVSYKKYLDPERFNILYTGAMGKANNLEVLLQAAAILKKREDIIFTLVGEGAARESLEKLSEELELKNVCFMKPVQKEQIPQLLKESDLLYVGLRDLALYRFGMSMNKLFDYMAAAKPIVFAANVFDNPLDVSGCIKTVKADDPEAIAKEIDRLYNYSSADRETIGRCLREFVKKHFDIKIIAADFEKILKKAINEYS